MYEKYLSYTVSFYHCLGCLRRIVNRAADRQQAITVYYIHRPPYYINTGNITPSGFIINIGIMIFKQAGLSCQFVELPPKRILQEIRQQEYACSIGWFKNPERMVFAAFSQPIYQNQPTIMVMRQGYEYGLPAKPTLQQVMESPLVLGVINGFSYGSKIDDAISRFKPSIYGISGDSENLLKMISMNRLDYVFMAPEEANFFISRDFLLKSGLQIVAIADEPEGNYRYIMFSKGVPRQIIDRIDAAIEVIHQSDQYAELISPTNMTK